MTAAGSIGSRSTRSARIRSDLGHPVVDADGHWIETAPVMKEFFLDFVRDLGGGDLAARFEAAGGLDYDGSPALGCAQRRGAPGELGDPAAVVDSSRRQHP